MLRVLYIHQYKIFLILEIESFGILGNNMLMSSNSFLHRNIPFICVISF